LKKTEAVIVKERISKCACGGRKSEFKGEAYVAAALPNFLRFHHVKGSLVLAWPNLVSHAQTLSLSLSSIAALKAETVATLLFM
jgi:hypothetical protein